MNLAQALEHLDERGELSWRVANAASAGSGGFWPALRGWQQTLVLRAQQLEQDGLQLFAVGLIMVNGAVIAWMGATLLLIFVSLIETLIA